MYNYDSYPHWKEVSGDVAISIIGYIIFVNVDKI